MVPPLTRTTEKHSQRISLTVGAGARLVPCAMCMQGSVALVLIGWLGEGLAATVDNKPEAELVRAAQAGDREAFARLYALYARPVHAVILARAPAGEANDLVQDVFVSALKRLASLREPEAFGGWLMMIARNRATDFHRRKKPTAELNDGDLASADAPLTEARRVLAVILELPDAYHETLLMRLVEGMTGPEIAARVGMKPESVRVNLHRGMKLLREKLGLESDT